MTRVSVPVPEEIKKQVDQCPSELGLDPSASEAQRYAALMDAGARAMRAQVRNERRRLSYDEHNSSQGYVDALDVSEDLAFGEGGF
jgi:Arc/MetJ-type ribon-helix-helix transcriptional regulator